MIKFKDFIKGFISIISLSSIPLIMNFWFMFSNGSAWGLSGFLATILTLVVANIFMWNQE